MNCKTRHKLIHKCQDLDFYFLPHSYKLKSQNVVMYDASISTMRILKIYGVLKYMPIYLDWLHSLGTRSAAAFLKVLTSSAQAVQPTQINAWKVEIIHRRHRKEALDQWEASIHTPDQFLWQRRRGTAFSISWVGTPHSVANPKSKCSVLFSRLSGWYQLEWHIKSEQIYSILIDTCMKG